MDESLEFAYSKAKEVAIGTLTISEAVNTLINERNFNPSSANTVIRVFQQMLSGDNFTRTLSLPYFEFFLEKIYSEFGIAKLDLALKAINKHMLYIQKRDPKIGLKLLVNKYAQKILINQNGQSEIKIDDETEQEEIADNLENSLRATIISQLENIKETDSELVIINGKAYKRDNRTIAQIKFIRGFKCQICSTYILKTNGKKYIEAAHIVPKSKKGPETPGNIILLCPNHHKEFDYGLRETFVHDENQIHFKLNGAEFLLKLKLE